MRVGSAALAVVRVAVLLLAVGPCAAQATARVLPPVSSGVTYGLVTVAVVFELRGTPDMLGSYGATLSWDAAVLQYVSDDGGGDQGFDTAVVNRGATGAGLLRFSDASVEGTAGAVEVFGVTFRVVASPPLDTIVDLEVTSAYAAGTYEDLVPGLNVTDGLLHVIDYALELRPQDGTGELFEWSPIPDALAYDLIRGELAQVLDDGAAVRLGNVTCIEDDSADTTTADGTEPASPDTQIPNPGQVFFYVVRPVVADGPLTWGFDSTASRERLPDSGQCP